MKKLVLFLTLSIFLFIVGCNKSNEMPVILGADDVEIMQGETFDETLSVTATDKEDGDLTSSIEIDGFVDSTIIGEHAVTYMVTDSDGNVTRVTRTITVKFEVDNPYDVYNGDFSKSDASWSFDKPGGEAEFKVINEELVVNILNPAQEWWNLQAHQTISIENEKSYKISFDGKSDGSKVVGIGLEDTADGYKMLPGGNVAFDMTNDYQTFSYVYTSDRTIDTAKVVIYLGRIGSQDGPCKVYIDNVNIEEVTLDTSDIVLSGVEESNVMINGLFDSMDGVTATDSSGNDISSNITIRGTVKTDLEKGAGFVLQYVVSDGTTTLVKDRLVNVVLGKTNLWGLFNSDFALGTMGWTLDFPVGEGQMSVEDEVLKAELTNLGDEWWHIQLFQDGISIEEGKSYKVSFKAKADSSKRIGLGIEDPADGWVDLKGESIEWDLTNEFVTYEYIFNAPRTIDTTKYAIFLGKIADTDELTTVYIDDFKVVELAEGGRVSIVNNSTFEDDSSWNFDFPVGTGTMIAENGGITADLTNIGDAWWHIQLQQTDITIEEGKTYIVSVDLSTDTPRRVGLGIEDAADNFVDLKGESVGWDITTETMTYYYAFKAPRSINTAKLALFLGKHLDTDAPGIVYIDNFNMVQADEHNILLNSNFDNDDDWTYDFPVGTGTMAASNNQLDIALTNIGDAWWHVQLHQTDVSIVEGRQYLVTFKVSSDITRRIGLGIEDAADNFVDLKGESVEWDIDANLRTYSFVFDNIKTIDTAKFAIFLGKHLDSDDVSNIVVKDFMVIEIG